MTESDESDYLFECSQLSYERITNNAMGFDGAFREEREGFETMVIIIDAPSSSPSSSSSREY